MRRATIAIGGALGLSVAANAWLLARGSDEPRIAPQAHADDGPAPAMPSPDVPARVAAPVTCEVRLASTRTRIAHLAKEVERHRKLEDRYAGPPRSLTTERTIGAELARVWSGAPDWMKWQVECHGQVCRVDVARFGGDPPFDWMQKVQGDVTAGLTDGMSFSSVDPKTDEPLGHPQMYIALAEPGDYPGEGLLAGIEQTFENGDAEEDCAKRDPTAGTLEITLTLDPVARTVAVSGGGSLAGTVSAKCLLDALEAVIAADPVPLNSTAATSHFTVTMPVTR